MRVAVIGGGFSGLSAAITLVENGHTPVIYESGDHCGGLADGFNTGNWRWNLESFYHHVFTNDRDIVDLANKVGAQTLLLNPETTSYIKDKEQRLDSPLSLLKFSGISFFSRLRMGVGLLILKLIPNGLFLEKFLVKNTLPKLIGAEGYKAIWEKLLIAKFGPYANKVNMAWFWSRVSKRTKNLIYFEGGFGKLIDKIILYLTEHGGNVRLNSPAKNIFSKGDKVLVDGEIYDGVITTIPASKTSSLIKEAKIPELEYLWAQTMILELSRKFIKGYWMNILDDNFPFLVAVEHTNMIDKKNYGGNRIVYLGNYLPEDHKQLKMNSKQLLNLYLPYLKRINPYINRNMIKKSYLFREPYAQPVFPVNYSQIRPKEKIKDRIYMANMSMVYPFDRGTNYAVKAGREVAELLIKEVGF